MAKRLSTLKPDELERRIDAAHEKSAECRRLHDFKGEERWRNKARKLGAVLAEVRTGDLFACNDPVCPAHLRQRVQQL